MLTLSDYHRCEILLVPTFSLGNYYVKQLGDKVLRYDNRSHIVYLKNGDPLLMMTFQTGILDGFNIRITRINMSLISARELQKAIDWLVEWKPAIDFNNSIFLNE